MTIKKDSDFSLMIEKNLSRRDFIQLTGAGIGLFLASTPLATAVSAATESKSSLLGFSAVPASTADQFIVPEGYVAQPLIAWGDPILKDAPAFDQSGRQPSAAQAAQFGDNTDGMSFFPLSDERALLAINNEYTNYDYLFAHDGKALTADDVKKSQAAHGVSIFEIQRDKQGQWGYTTESKYNRRITAYTEMELTGPVAGSDLVKTAADPTGRKVFGTFNNCANGQTPWGTGCVKTSNTFLRVSTGLCC